MKFAIVILAVVAAATAQYRGFPSINAKPYNRFGSSPTTYRPFVPTPAPQFPYVSSTRAPPTVPVPVPYVKAVADARNANTIKYENEIGPDGSYFYAFETENGIGVQERGVPRNFGGNPPVVPVVAEGSYSYTSPEGVPVSVGYVADENGFQPSGNVLPVGPPIPPLIERALAYLRSVQ